MAQTVRVAGRSYVPGASRGVAALLTSAAWVLAQLPERVVERQRGDLVRTLAATTPIIIEIEQPSMVRIKAGTRLLLELPVESTRQARDQATGRWARASAGN
jgi:hypothetical protein